MPEALAIASITLRPAQLEDAAPIAAIWNREVLETDHTTDTEPRDAETQRAWLAAHGDDHPVLVALAGEAVVGYGALSLYRPKPAFRRTVEDSVYVKDGYRGRGAGTAILGGLLTLARTRGHHVVIARVTAPNVASIALHERHGFARAGTERQTAWKHGRWLDVVVLEKILE